MPFSKIIQRYCDVLHRKPLLVKSVTSAVLLSVADSIAQWATWAPTHVTSPESTNDSPGSCDSYRPLAHQDFRRTVTMMMYAALCVTPFAHHWYRLLDRLVKMPAHVARWSPTAAGVVLRRVFLDQLIAAPVFITGMFTTRGLIAGASPDAIASKLRDEYAGMFCAGLMVWPSAQCLNMWLIPLQFRVLFNNCVGLGWSVFSSSAVRYHDKKEETDQQTDDDTLQDKHSKFEEVAHPALRLPPILVHTQDAPAPTLQHRSNIVDEKSPRTTRQSLWQNRIKNKMFAKANASPMPSPKASPRSQRSNKANHHGILERVRLGLLQEQEQEPIATEQAFAGNTSLFPNTGSPVFLKRRPSRTSIRQDLLE